VVTTDLSGNPFVYQSSGWTAIGGGFRDQLAVNHGGIVALTKDHGSILLNAGGGSGWSLIGGAADELFVGSGRWIAATLLGSSKSVELYRGDGSPWTTEGLPGNMFACTQDNDLFALSSARTAVTQDNFAGPWNTIGGGKGKLVQKTDTTGYLYAAGNVVY
jgi:hypothetical protein